MLPSNFERAFDPSNKYFPEVRVPILPSIVKLVGADPLNLDLAEGSLESPELGRDPEGSARSRLQLLTFVVLAVVPALGRGLKMGAAAVTGAPSLALVALAFMAHFAGADVPAVVFPLPSTRGSVPFAVVDDAAGW
ncbi:hypothetical protein D4765_10115 [Subtercola vilae]|uniref:Uncharacterized protein n=1 Tax=Subtercola vilae TaxID=2056433 RepID=A0A4T2BWI8_9MICO|nr:hypothetical protein D4765_10115 [Subtercola vilae]